MAAKTRLTAVAVCLTMTCAGPASAHWGGAALGRSYGALKADYPEAVEMRDETSHRLLQLPSFRYAGVNWSRAWLVFDARDRLDHVTFEVRGLDSDSVKARINAAFREPVSVRSAFLQGSGFQMRICQLADGRVDVTFEGLRFES